MRDYELMFLAQPELDDAGVSALVTLVGELVKRDGGAVNFAGQMVDKRGNLVEVSEGWKTRALAYVMGGKRRGYYVVMRISASPAALLEMDRVLKLNENVLRFLLLQRDAKVAS